MKKSSGDYKKITATAFRWLTINSKKLFEKKWD